jgi:hypothetical protein
VGLLIVAASGAAQTAGSRLPSARHDGAPAPHPALFESGDLAAAVVADGHLPAPDRFVLRFRKVRPGGLRPGTPGGQPAGAAFLPETLLINLFEDATFLADGHATTLADGAAMWRGRVRGHERSHVVIVSRGDAVAASINVDGRAFQITRTRDGGHLVEEVELTGACDHAPVALAGGGGPDVAAEAPAPAGAAWPVIDLLVVYTAQARAQAGGTAGILNAIDVAVANMNAALASSAVTGQIRLVHTAEVPYVGSGDLGLDLERLRRPGDGHLDEVHALRNSVGADLVALLTDRTFSTTVGIAYLLQHRYAGEEAYAFSVTVQRHASQVLSHEIGHNLGLAHDRLNSASTGAYPYAHGYQDPPYFRDLMAYECYGTSCPRLLQFSNPRVTHLGRPTGRPELEDNARALEQTIPTAAAFRSPAPTIGGLVPATGSLSGGTRVTITGTGFAAGAVVHFGTQLATSAAGLDAATLVVTTPPFRPGPADVSVRNPDGASATRPNAFTYRAAAFLDQDGDGLPDEWEVLMGLDPASASGDDGASGDPDGDGLTNAEEYAAGTHPRGFHRRYLAEGALSSAFTTRLAMLNPETRPGSVAIRYLLPGGGSVGHLRVLPPRTRITVDPASVGGLAGLSFSTLIESDVPVVVDRTMSWGEAGARYGSHAETAVTSPATTWYLAEGATHSRFDLFYLLQNPNDTEVTLDVEFMLPAGRPPLTRRYRLPPRSRENIHVNAVPGLAATDVSAVFRVVSGGPIVVERAMYQSRTRPFEAGHNSAAVASPAPSWFLAEGATGDLFDMYILLANPNAFPVVVDVTYLLPSGPTVLHTYSVAPRSRETIVVEREDPRLSHTALSAIVTARQGAPIVVERAMWWPGGPSTWEEAHNSFGTTATGTRWALAEGAVGGPFAEATYILVANTSTTPGRVRLTVLLEDGRQASQEVAVGPSSRTTVAVTPGDIGQNAALRALFPDAAISAGVRFSAIVESVAPDAGQPLAQIVVERSMYSSDAGPPRFVPYWPAGTSAVATRLQ